MVKSVGETIVNKREVLEDVQIKVLKLVYFIVLWKRYNYRNKFYTPKRLPFFFTFSLEFFLIHKYYGNGQYRREVASTWSDLVFS